MSGPWVKRLESGVLPELDLARLAPFVQRPDQHEALKDFRAKRREK